MAIDDRTEDLAKQFAKEHRCPACKSSVLTDFFALADLKHYVELYCSLCGWSSDRYSYIDSLEQIVENEKILHQQRLKMGKLDMSWVDPE